jgi:hypothetical protein
LNLDQNAPFPSLSLFASSKHFQALTSLQFRG